MIIMSLSAGFLTGSWLAARHQTLGSLQDVQKRLVCDQSIAKGTAQLGALQTAYITVLHNKEVQ